MGVKVGATTLSKVTPCIMTLSITGLFATLRINRMKEHCNIQYSGTRHDDTIVSIRFHNPQDVDN